MSECALAGGYTSTKTLSTVLTLVWLVSSTYVSECGDTSTKPLSTELTFVWLVSCMCPNVALQVAYLNKTFFHRTHTCVACLLYVPLQVGTCPKTIFTELTLVWLVSCVSERAAISLYYN